MIESFRRHYGANPLHLLAHVAAFAIAGFALDQILSAGNTEVNFIVWFVGAAILHDVVFVPIYSLLDRVARRGASAAPAVGRRVPVINHVRAPALISGVLLLVYFPVIFRPGDSTYFAATGHHLRGYGRNWLLITAVLFLGSALVYAVRLRGARGGGHATGQARRRPPDDPPASS